jgi:hypothetical protein
MVPNSSALFGRRQYPVEHLSRPKTGIICELVCELCKTAPERQDQRSRTTLLLSRILPLSQITTDAFRIIRSSRLPQRLLLQFTPLLLSVSVVTSPELKLKRSFCATALLLCEHLLSPFSLSGTNAQGPLCSRLKIRSLHNRREKVQDRICCIAMQLHQPQVCQLCATPLQAV